MVKELTGCYSIQSYDLNALIFTSTSNSASARPYRHVSKIENEEEKGKPGGKDGNATFSYYLDVLYGTP